MKPSVLVAICVTVLAWASAFVVIRFAGVSFEGGSLALLRLAVGTLLLGVVVALGRKWVRPNRNEWLLILGFGVLWFGAYNVALTIAEHTIDAGTTSMIVNIGPILIALGAGVFLGERISKWLAIGAGVAFVGVVLIGVSTSSGPGISGAGILWALLAALTYAAGVLLQKPALKRLPNAQVTFLGCAIGLVACLPFVGQLASDLATAPTPAILGAVYLGAVPTALAFSTWAYALSRLPAGQLGVSTYIVPPLAILLGFLVFTEVPGPLAIVGGVLCLAGVAVSRIRARVTAQPENVAE
jgi:drug/metabolite transporter (DMT)-like permease